ncbi:MAG TPA: hypothetical protein VMV10_25505 [Pirellulales bacterium]|nr:hypothetical protein [Pirellulales bacterium]
MASELAKTIENWFAANGDGEFVVGEDAGPYSVIPPGRESARIIFSTKASLIAMAIERCPRRGELGMVARQGLPNEADLRWLRGTMGASELWFLGDMDPPDLMIFAWLRHHLPEKQILHLGVSDAYLAALQLSLSESFVVRCSNSERSTMETLAAVFPDFREVTGPKCASLLEQGSKIEVEAVVSAAGSAAPILLPVFSRLR